MSGGTTFPKYLDCRRVLDCLLAGDVGEIAAVRARMSRAIDQAATIAEGADIELWSRVAVVTRVSPDGTEPRTTPKRRLTPSPSEPPGNGPHATV